VADVSVKISAVHATLARLRSDINLHQRRDPIPELALPLAIQVAEKQIALCRQAACLASADDAHR